MAGLSSRIMNLEGRRILLPDYCNTPHGKITFEQLQAVIKSDIRNILITGDTGTGKEVVKDCIFDAVKKSKQQCESANCAEFDENLIGSELFGHTKGAFTDAVKERAGILKACDGGIVFLDEIGWMPRHLQARLLRCMESGRIRKVGSDTFEPVNVRIIAATNKDVSNDEVLIHDLRARFDFELRLPLLRERGADVLWFICQSDFLCKGGVYTALTMETMLRIFAYEWPANIRELQKYCSRQIFLQQPLSNESEKATQQDKPAQLSWVCKDNQLGGSNAITAWIQLAKSLRAKVRIEASLTDPAKRLISLLEAIDCCEGPDAENVSLNKLRGLLGADVDDSNGFDAGLLRSLAEPPATTRRQPNQPRLLKNPLNVTVGDMDGVVGFSDILTALGKMANDLWEVLPFPGPAGRRQGGDAQSGLLHDALFVDQHDDKSEFERVLDECKVVGRDRDICILCNNNLSTHEISAELNRRDQSCPQSTVRDVLQRLRANHPQLESHLPRQNPGRRATSISSVR